LGLVAGGEPSKGLVHQHVLVQFDGVLRRTVAQQLTVPFRGPRCLRWKLLTTPRAYALFLPIMSLSMTLARLVTTATAGLVVALAGWSALATAGTSDLEVARQVLASVASSAPISSGHSPTAYAEQQAHLALERADDTRRAGDLRNSAHLEGLAREWAELARDTRRALELETKLEAVQRRAASETQALRRERALLDELMARRARAEGELQELRSATDASIPAAAVAAARARAAGPASASGSSVAQPAASAQRPSSSGQSPQPPQRAPQGDAQ
jgi:hypothetical protein